MQPEGVSPSGLPQRAEKQSSEGQRSKAWAHHHANAEVVEDVARVEVVAMGTARALMISPDGAAPRHGVNIIWSLSLQLFPAIVWFIWIWKDQFIPC